MTDNTISKKTDVWLLDQITLGREIFDSSTLVQVRAKVVQKMEVS